MTYAREEGLVDGDRTIAWDDVTRLTLVFYKKQLLLIRFKNRAATGRVYSNQILIDVDLVLRKLDSSRIKRVQVVPRAIASLVATTVLLVLMEVLPSLFWILIPLLMVLTYFRAPWSDLLDNRRLNGAALIGLAIAFIMRLLG